MKTIIANLQTKPVPGRVALAGLISVGLFALSPVVISSVPFGFPMVLGPVLMVAVPALCLKLLQRKLSLITIVAGTMLTEFLVNGLWMLVPLQVTTYTPWLIWPGYVVGFIGVWLGMLILATWLARWAIARWKHGEQTKAAVVVGGIVLLVAAGIYGAQWAIIHQPIYKTAAMSQDEVDARKARIVAIYDSLGLDADYALTSENIFGEKRVYSGDDGRSFSSSRMYVHQAEVDATVAELRPKIEQAGFSFVGEPYPNAIDKQLHFRSVKGEYIRLTVSSKPRDDALQATRGKNVDYDNLPTGAPSNVLIKVNLDDNNE